MVVHSNMANATSDHSLYFWCEIISAPNEQKYAVADRTMLSNMGHSCCIISGINDFLAVVERVSSVMVLMCLTTKSTAAISRPLDCLVRAMLFPLAVFLCQGLSLSPEVNNRCILSNRQVPCARDKRRGKPRQRQHS